MDSTINNIYLLILLFSVSVSFFFSFFFLNIYPKTMAIKRKIRALFYSTITGMFCYLRNFLIPKVHNCTHLNHFSLLALASQTTVASLQKNQMIICDKQFYIKYLFPGNAVLFSEIVFLRVYNVFFGGLDCSSGPVYFKSGHPARL